MKDCSLRRVTRKPWMAPSTTPPNTVTTVASHWMYSGALNYYRLASRRESLDKISGAQIIPGDRDVYVLHSIFDEQFIQDQRLRERGIAARVPPPPQMTGHIAPRNRREDDVDAVQKREVREGGAPIR